MCSLEEKIHNSAIKDMHLKGIEGNHLTNLLDLSSDMKYLLQSTILTDVKLCLNGKYEMYCHKDILKFRSKWFYNAVCKADAKGVDVIDIDEDPRVMEAVLSYIYTGNLLLLESLNIYLVEVYEAAEKYGFTRLRGILGRMLRESKYCEKMKYAHFQWLVKVGDDIFQDVECPVLSNFTICGNDKWQLKAKCIKYLEEDGYGILIYLERKTKEPRKTAHTVNLVIHVTDSNGECQYFLTDKHNFLEDGEYILSKHIPITTLMNESENLLTNGMLTMTFELTFFARVGFLNKFKLSDPFRRYIFNELVYLSEDMFNVFRDGKTHDIRFGRCHVNIHHYILLVRTRIARKSISDLEKIAGFRKLLWTSFAAFLYTGQSRFLDEHARVVYSALSEMKLPLARKRYSDFLAKNLNLENAFYIMNDAVTYKDTSLLFAAANFLASKSEIESDPQVWIRIANEKTNRLKFLSQSLTFKQIF